MNLSKLTKFQKKEISLSQASIVAGLGLLIMVLSVPFVEFYVFPKFLSDDPIETANKIIENRTLFTVGLFLHLITILCDVAVAWALYIFLKPVHEKLSLLTAWFRLIYSAMYLVAFFNLIKVLNLINNQSNGVEVPQFYYSISFYINSFQLEWAFGLGVFGIYLTLLGFLVLKSTYVPNYLGVLLLIGGLGYIINTVCLFLFPNINTEFLMITFFGELIFMFWLLIKGSRIKT